MPEFPRELEGVSERRTDSAAGFQIPHDLPSDLGPRVTNGFVVPIPVRSVLIPFLRDAHATAALVARRGFEGERHRPENRPFGMEVGVMIEPQMTCEGEACTVNSTCTFRMAGAAPLKKIVDHPTDSCNAGGFRIQIPIRHVPERRHHATSRLEEKPDVGVDVGLVPMHLRQ